MTHQAKRIRAVYTLLTLLAVLLPMTGWFAHSLTAPKIAPNDFIQAEAMRCSYTAKQGPMLCASTTEPIAYGVRVDYVRR